MFSKVPVKKEYLLIAGTIILLWLSYRLAIKHTIEAWQTNKELKTKIKQTSDLSYQPDYLERKNSNLNKILDLYKADTLEFRSKIISTISGIAEKNNVKLTEVPIKDASYSTDKFIIEKLSFEGNYFALVKLIDQLQRILSIGVIRSESLKAPKANSGNKINPNILLLTIDFEFRK